MEHFSAFLEHFGAFSRVFHDWSLTEKFGFLGFLDKKHSASKQGYVVSMFGDKVTLTINDD